MATNTESLSLVTFNNAFYYTRKLKPKDDDNVIREIEVMKILRTHANIIGLIESFETEETFHIVIDLARGGDLMRSITRRKRYTEFDGRALAREFLQAVHYIHSCDVVHRDLKPDNLLLDAPDDDSHGVRIADFGFAKKLNRNGRLKSRCGTPAYVAPEICVGVEYGKGVDVWSCGVIIYLLLSGKIPFTVKRRPGKRHDLKALFLKIRGADYVFEDQDWDVISMSAKQLIAQMLTVDPKRRITLNEALKSPWMTKKDEELGLSARVPLKNTITSLKQFNARRSLKSAMIATSFVTTANFWTPESVTFMSNNTTVGSTVFAPTATAVSTKTLTSGKVGQKLENMYSLEDKIRDSEAGTTIRKGFKKGTHEVYAIKIINRGLGQGHMSAEDNKVMNEVSILQSLSHNHVVKLYDFFEETTRFCVVMEFMGGGDLFERIVTKEMYTEMDAREVAKALLSAVDYIHKRGVAHRDLKPQNLLLVTRNNDTFMKIGDFGFAKRVHTPKSLFTRCGTPTYVAPEILKGHPYDEAVDMWSVGVIIYVALVGYPPFLEQDQRVMLDKIRRGAYEFYPEDWSNISKQAKNLIKNLLKVDPDSRFVATKALDHEWMVDIRADQLMKTKLKTSLDKLSKQSLDLSYVSSTHLRSYSTLPVH